MILQCNLCHCHHVWSWGVQYLVLTLCSCPGVLHVVPAMIETNKVLGTFPSLLWSFFKGKYTLILSLTMSSVLDKPEAAWEQRRKFIFFHSYISNNQIHSICLDPYSILYPGNSDSQLKNKISPETSSYWFWTIWGHLYLGSGYSNKSSELK